MTIHQLAQINPLPLIQAVEALETCGGNLDTFIANHTSQQANPEQMLFWFELQLMKPENAALKERWQSALRLSAKIRMDKLTCRALRLLETYQNLSPTSSATDISYCRTILSAILTDDNERMKSKYRVNTVAEHNEEADELDELEKEFSQANG